jgi:tetratricopeptide (TPR) repeat protein
LIKNKNRTLLKNILEESDEVIQNCPNRISDANAIKGMAFYHLGNYLIAKKYFETSVEQDESNSIANFYLLNTLMKLDDKASAEKIIHLLLKYSPDVLTNYFDSETKNYN